MLQPVEHVGAAVQRTLHGVGATSLLLMDVGRWVARSARGRVRFGRTAYVSQMVRIGVRSVGIVTLVCSAIGFILAMQMAGPLDEFGQTDKIANIVGVAVFRELGPLVAAIVLTGFAGAAIAAEIGTMVVGEEIEALEAHALNPVRFLVVPRVLATVTSLLLLTVLADVVAVVAAGVMAVAFIGVPLELFNSNLKASLDPSDFFTGLGKSVVFGTILAAIACVNGLAVTGGAAGVGRATTNTVVQTVVAVVVADLFITALLFKLGVI
ncbi:MAG: MlaE family ABC transporter permease [Planctomycetota bacterium]|jgi:phospholipid/cholesterol/gamma-HCH transport system permease protein